MFLRKSQFQERSQRNTSECLLMNFIHHSRFNRQHKENTDISKLQKTSWQKRCLQGNEGNAGRNEKAVQQKDQLTEFHTNIIQN